MRSRCDNEALITSPAEQNRNSKRNKENERNEQTGRLRREQRRMCCACNVNASESICFNLNEKYLFCHQHKMAMTTVVGAMDGEAPIEDCAIND